MATTVLTNLQPGVNNSQTFGGSALYWASLYAVRHYFNSTAYLDGGTAGQTSSFGNLVVDAGTSSTSSPATIGISNFASVGRAGRVQFADANNALQVVNSGAMQINSYHRLEIQGGTQSSATFFTGTKKGITLNGIQTMVNSTQDSVPTLGIQRNTATQTSNMLNVYDEAGVVLAAVTSTGKILASNSLQIGTSSTSGYVWTATDTAGNGSWQVAGSGTTTSFATITKFV